MRSYKEDQEDDLSSDFGDAYAEIMNTLRKNLPQVGALNWRLERAYVSWHGKEYTLSAIFTAYDSEIKEIIKIGCSTTGHQLKDGFETSLGKKQPVEYDPYRNEYVSIKIHPAE